MLGWWLGFLTCWGTWVHTSDPQWVRSTRHRARPPPGAVLGACALDGNWQHHGPLCGQVAQAQPSTRASAQPPCVCVCVCVSVSLPATCSSLLSRHPTGHLASASASLGVLLLDSCPPVDQSCVWRMCCLMFCAFPAPPRCCSLASLRLFLNTPPRNIPYPGVLLATPAPCPPWADAVPPRRGHSTALSSRFLHVVASPLPSFPSAPVPGS